MEQQNHPTRKRRLELMKNVKRLKYFSARFHLPAARISKHFELPSKNERKQTIYGVEKWRLHTLKFLLLPSFLTPDTCSTYTRSEKEEEDEWAKDALSSHAHKALMIIDGNTLIHDQWMKRKIGWKIRGKFFRRKPTRHYENSGARRRDFHVDTMWRTAFGGKYRQKRRESFIARTKTIEMLDGEGNFFLRAENFSSSALPSRLRMKVDVVAGICWAQGKKCKTLRVFVVFISSPPPTISTRLHGKLSENSLCS